MSRFDQAIDTIGDGSGISNMARVADNYFIRPSPSQEIELVRINIVMQDTGKFAGEKYSVAGALTTGISITKKDETGILHNFTPVPIKRIGQWGLLAGVDMIMTDFTVGDDIVLVRWTLEKAGASVFLDGTKGEFFQVSVPDTLAAFVDHTMHAQGQILWKGR
ncbi:MAG: hypothetical protein E4H01_11825 [Lysobacterales bacterium]|nr:MAG: hypothetical protein E4H01_11825 [Xanthomonadales bacterium]